MAERQMPTFIVDFTFKGEFYAMRSSNKLQYAITQCVAAGLTQTDLWLSYGYTDEDLSVSRVRHDSLTE